MLLLVAIALAENVHVVHSGETVESIAGGDPLVAAAIREQNGLAPGVQPRVGDVLELPGEGHDSSARLLSWSGLVTLTDPSGQTIAPMTGIEIPIGSQICTGAASLAAVRLAVAETGHNHDDIHLLPDTCVVVSISHAGGGQRTSLINMSRGAVSILPGIDKEGTVAIRTESGITTGEEGGFRVTVEPGATRSEALDGAIAVIGAEVERRLQINQGSRTRTGEAPSEPVWLLPPGTPLLPAVGSILRSPDFRWVPVPDALGYRVELAASEDFSRTVRVEDVAGATWQPEYLFLPSDVPSLWWRISSFDRNGFLGHPSEPQAVTLPLGWGG